MRKEIDLNENAAEKLNDEVKNRRLGRGLNIFKFLNQPQAILSDLARTKKHAPGLPQNKISGGFEFPTNFTQTDLDNVSNVKYAGREG